MLVTPLRDGMNLVAKEYVASRVDATGALVLSEFAGAARELHSAILVNPHDLDGIKDAIRHVIDLDPVEAKAADASPPPGRAPLRRVRVGAQLPGGAPTARRRGGLRVSRQEKDRCRRRDPRA